MVLKEKTQLSKAKKKGNNTKDLFVKIKDLNNSKAAKGKWSGNKVSVPFVYIILLIPKHRE